MTKVSRPVGDRNERPPRKSRAQGPPRKGSVGRVTRGSRKPPNVENQADEGAAPASARPQRTVEQLRSAYAYLLGARHLPAGEDAALAALARYGLDNEKWPAPNDGEGESVGRARILVNQLEGWARELLSPSLSPDRRNEIEKAINCLYLAREGVELENFKRIDVIESIRLVVRFYVPELLERMMKLHPEHELRLAISLLPWRTPAGLVAELVRVRWPTIAAALERVEAETGLLSGVINLWRGGARGRANEQIYIKLSDLFSQLGMPYGAKSLTAKYSKWFGTARDEVEERMRLWSRLSVILENTGFSETSVAGELERCWAEIQASRRGGAASR